MPGDTHGVSAWFATMSSQNQGRLHGDAKKAALMVRQSQWRLGMRNLPLVSGLHVARHLRMLGALLGWKAIDTFEFRIIIRCCASDEVSLLGEDGVGCF